MTERRAKWGTALEWLRAAQPISTTECVPWPFSLKPNGYPQVRYDGKTCYAHRLMCEWAHGPAPDGASDVAHDPLACHNRGCVNPRHLRWASRSENMQDAVLDGTAPKGERHGGAVLTRDDVITIRAALRAGETQAALARRYRVTSGTIWHIKAGRSWRDAL